MDRFYIDVGPLQEAEYTGIPQVAAKLCEQLLGDASVDPGFFCNRHEVPAAMVEHMLKARTGKLFRWAAERYCLRPATRRPVDGRTIGLHCNIKSARRLFPTEGQIIHDLTTVVTPQFHTRETIDSHQGNFYADLMSNDVTFCVSGSTATDVRMFYPEMPGPVIVIPLGVDWDHVDEQTRALELEAENYIFVLGTLEPRKNVLDILDLLAERPQLARMYRFVFGGRVGWGDSFERQVIDRGMGRLLDDKRIVRTGFVSETAKYLLIKHAAALIYPSVYEGFGLPVAEALSLGVPVVTTPSTSLPEVGGDLARYFVPGDLVSLSAALTAALRQRPVTHGAGGGTAEDWLARFSWKACYGQVRDALLAAASAVPQLRADPTAADLPAEPVPAEPEDAHVHI